MKQNSKVIINANKELSAQTNRLCSGVNATITPNDGIDLELRKIFSVSETMFVIASLQYIYALRISEVLQLRYEDIDRVGRVVVRGAKGSNDRLISVREFSIYSKYLNGAKGKLFDNVDRFFVYRFYKKMGLYFSIDGNENKSVTHSLRYYSQNEILKSSESVGDKKILLGHKNVNNSIRYETKFKSKKNS